MKLLTISVALLAASLTLATAASKPPVHSTKPASLICPVTGNKIASVKDAVGHETYKGKTYYFCCPECKPRFDKNRSGIAAHAAKGHYEKM